MSHHSFYHLFITSLILTHLPTLPAPPILPQPDPTSTQTQNFLPTQTPPSTIPAFPSQSNIAGCPLDLPNELFHNIKPACQSKHHQPDPNSYPGQLLKNRCCPVLAAWIYSAYSKTALQGAITSTPPPLQTSPVDIDMPVLPDDSETCVENLEKELQNKGIKLFRPNDTCDAIYCYCGIKLHSFSCPQAFFVNQDGKLVGDGSVKRLEKDCLSHNSNGYSGLGSCSKCLNSLSMLSENKSVNISKSDDKRSSNMRSKDCELMGLTWLLNKNRTAYIRTVSAVLRALMMSNDVYSDSHSCTLNSDDMPLAVDSSEVNDQSAGAILQMSMFLIMFALMCISFVVSINGYF